METNTNKISSKKLARITGIFYFLIIFCGLFGSMVVRGNIINPTNQELTLQNLINNESMYRIGFMCDFIMVLSDVVISLLFYFLLKPINQSLALFATIFRLLQSSVLSANLINLFKPLLLIKENADMNTDELIKLGSEVLVQLEIFEYGYLISGVFFSVNCFFMAILLHKSELFPSIFGIMLFAAAIGYLFNCLANFLIPSLVEISQIILLFTAIISELALCLYLIIKGTKKEEKLMLY